MSIESNETRDKALKALTLYAISLKNAGYNNRCIQDSVIVLSLDIVLRIEKEEDN